MKNEKITSLQTLRAIAFLGILFQHCGLGLWGTQGVSVFIVLSGFLMTYNYYYKENKLPYNIKDSIIWGVRKIKKIYSLHLLTMIICLFIAIYGMYRMNRLELYDWMTLLEKILVHVLLLQGYFFSKDICYGLNGVSWYLSVSLLCYIIFPIFFHLLKKKHISTCEICLLLFSLIFFRCIIILILIYFKNQSIISGNIFTRMTYNFPIFRLIDFGLGCVLGLIYTDNNSIIRIGSKKNKWLLTCAEIITIIVLLSGYQIFIKYFRQDNASCIVIILYNNLILISSILLVFLFSICEGFIFKSLNKCRLIYLGNISAYTYLIHGMLIYGLLRPIKNYNPIFKVTICFLFTIILSILYIKLENYVKRIIENCNNDYNKNSI